MALKYDLELVNSSKYNNVAFVVNGLEITYGALIHEVDLIAQNIKRGDLIFILAGNDYPPIVFYLACLRVGAVPLLLPKDISSISLNSLILRYEPNYIYKKIDEI